MITNGPDTGPFQSVLGISGFQVDAHGSVRVENPAGRSIGVLAIGFSQIMALKKHALLIFILS